MPAYNRGVQDPMLCALLDSIEGLLCKVRCADLTQDGAAQSWFASRDIALSRPSGPPGEPFDFVIAQGPPNKAVDATIAPDGLALLRCSPQETAQEPAPPWNRVAHVVSGRVHWQLWRREGPELVRESG